MQASYIERFAVVTQTLPGAAIIELRHTDTDEVSRALFDRMVAAMQPLKDVKSPRRLRRVLNEVVLTYYPVKLLLSTRILVSGVSQGQSVSQAVANLVGEAWIGLANLSSNFISGSDRRVILDLLRMQTEQAELAEQIPLENQPAFYSSIIDAFWSLQKMDLCFAGVAAIHFRDIDPFDSRLAHWLCLAIRDYLDDWYSTLFANNPVLKDRLSKPIDELNAISLEEWEREIGL